MPMSEQSPVISRTARMSRTERAYDERVSGKLKSLLKDKDIPETVHSPLAGTSPAGYNDRQVRDQSLPVIRCHFRGHMIKRSFFCRLDTAEDYELP